MSGNQQNYSLQVREIHAGLSAVVSLSFAQYRQGVALQVIAGGSCWFGGASLAVGGSFGLLAPTSIFTLYDYRGSINFTSVGATAVIRVMDMQSANV